MTSLPAILANPDDGELLDIFADVLQEHGDVRGPLIGMQLRLARTDPDDDAYDSQVGAFDAVLAAATMRSGASGLISADRAFAMVPGLVHVDPADLDLSALA